MAARTEGGVLALTLARFGGVLNTIGGASERARMSLGGGVGGRARAGGVLGEVGRAAGAYSGATGVVGARLDGLGAGDCSGPTSGQIGGSGKGQGGG